jgi:hypothetical protein
MKGKQDMRERTMSFSLGTLACRVILRTKGLPQTLSGQAWMHPQSKGDPVLGLHSCRALSPVPRPEYAARRQNCQRQN